MVDLTSHRVSFALLQGQLLAGEISRSAFLDRTSLLGAGTSEAARSHVRSSQSHQIRPRGRTISNPDSTTSLFDRAQRVPSLRDG
jgi:hypothetical protein